MKRQIIVLLFLILMCEKTTPQSNTINCYVPPGYKSSFVLQQGKNKSISSITAVTPLSEVIIVAKDYGANPTLPVWFDQVTDRLPQYFSEATFGNFSYTGTVLKDGGVRAYIMPAPYTPPFDGTCQHVHSESNIRAVLALADVDYNFANYADANNIVNAHFVSIEGSGNGGVVCQIDYLSNDYKNGSRVTVRIERQTRGNDQKNFFNIFCHESGHYYFGLPDMEHSASQTYDHWSLGSFEVMSTLGFGNIPSLYNPVFRVNNNWFTPTTITSSQNNVTLQDFQTSKQCYVYNSNSSQGGMLSSQRFYITHHNRNGYFYSNWPYQDPQKGGVLIWHETGGGSYADWRRMDIDLEAAHGKYDWTISPPNATNTGVQNPYTGRDSLEIRVVSSGRVVGGPYYNRDVGSGSIFFTPDAGKTFTPTSNPNSNWYSSNTNNYAQTGVSALNVTNIRSNSGSALVDFSFNSNYTIIQDMSFSSYAWSFDTDVIVNSGVTLTILPGASIYFTPGKKLIVYGTLNATNTTFTSVSSWGGITFQSGATGIMDGCTINYVDTYGGAAIVINNCSPTIQNCTIQPRNISNGISVLSNSTPYIYNNTIRMFGTSTNGIYVSQSSPYIRKNTIIGKNNSGSTGVYAYYISRPFFGVPYGSTEGKNEIQQFYDGIYAFYYCTVDAGSATLARDNVIYFNTNSNVYADYNSTVNARYNWWGLYPPDQTKFKAYNGSSIYWDPALSSPPAQGLLAVSTQNTSISPDEELLEKANELRQNKKYDESIKIYKSLLSSSANSNVVKKALVGVAFIYSGTKSPELMSIIDAYTQLKNDKYQMEPLAFELLSLLYTNNGDNLKAIEANNKLVIKFVNTENGNNGLMNLFYIYYNKKEYDLAASILSKVKANRANDYEILSAKWLLNVVGKWDFNTTLSKGITELSEKPSAVIEKNDGEILENYPNPFNPTTKISFSIPQKSQIKLKVFDALGREVANLADGVYDIGKYEITFDASKLPSGVYFYNLTTGSNSISKKMLLIK
ncbi:MAG: T9SS type A sorting domain-containing protein [Ignavibacteriales bacterium]|nr:T9SS type A sorting domain-containing protein [Ignavibacteriales bacterium]